MKTVITTIVLGCAFIAITTSVMALGEDKTQKSLTYTKDIAPLMKTYCQRCHSAAEEIEGGLSVDSLDGVLKGGEHGAAVVPGKPTESLLYQKLSANPPIGKQMPRGKKKLTESEGKLIYDWIAQGAKK